MKFKFRGTDMNGHYVYGLLTKKKIRSSGKISPAIAIGNCSLGETIPVSEDSVAQMIGYDKYGNEIYTDDIVVDSVGNEHCADEYFPLKLDVAVIGRR